MTLRDISYTGRLALDFQLDSWCTSYFTWLIRRCCLRAPSGEAEAAIVGNIKMMLTLLGGKTIVGWCPIQTRREHVLVDKPSGVLLIEAPAMATRSSHDSNALFNATACSEALFLKTHR